MIHSIQIAIQFYYFLYYFAMDKPLTQEERMKLVQKYENFIDNRLRVDLGKLLENREKIYEKISR